MAKKSNSSIVAKRVQEITTLLLEGHSRADILQFGSENWKLSERQIDSYIQSATDNIKAGIKRDVLFDYNMALMRFQELYKLATSRKDIRNAITINKEIANLQNLYSHPEIFEVDKELMEALTPLKLQQKMFEVPFNKFLEMPENSDLKERYDSYKFMEAYLASFDDKDEALKMLDSISTL